MTEACNNQCAGCSADCGDREEKDLREKPHARSKIKKVIVVVSGKGGVGKSLVTSLLAVNMNRAGYAAGVLDADITGPSIPRAFGLQGKPRVNEHGLYPAQSKKGIEVMSINLLLKQDTDPVVWRGSVISGMVKQFWSEIIWEDIDYLFVDLPPGTGDVPLTVFQTLPIDGIVIVTSPQELVSMIVEKAVNMAKMMNIPILSLVENMSYINCPDCGKEIAVFGKSRLEEIAKKHQISVTEKLPLDPNLAQACDAGQIETYEGVWLNKTGEALKQMLEK